MRPENDIRSPQPQRQPILPESLVAQLSLCLMCHTTCAHGCTRYHPFAETGWNVKCRQLKPEQRVNLGNTKTQWFGVDVLCASPQTQSSMIKAPDEGEFRLLISFTQMSRMLIYEALRTVAAYGSSTQINTRKRLPPVYLHANGLPSVCWTNDFESGKDHFGC